MFNSKDIKKIEEHHNIFVIHQYQKFEGYWIFVFSCNSMTQAFKNSDGNQTEWKSPILQTGTMQFI